MKISEKKGFPWANLIGGLIIIVPFVIVFACIYTPEEAPKCGRFTDEYPFKTGYDCCMSCKELKQDYFKHEDIKGFFSSSANCYCREGNQVSQVW